ncbi:MAG: site-2 protease family protein [Planctomycetaceae bacterium]
MSELQPEKPSIPAKPSEPVTGAITTGSPVESEDRLRFEEDLELERRRFRYYQRRQLRTSITLFLLTCLSTFVVGASFVPLEYLLTMLIPRYQWFVRFHLGGASLEAWLAEASWRGFTYAAPLMSILLFHEMGHFLQSVRYRIPASFPYFIPMPLSVPGTMGAVIFNQPGRATRRQLFDIAVSGPLAGLVVILPVLYYGLTLPTDPAHPSVPLFARPLLIKWMVYWIHGPQSLPETFINPVYLAGWFGVLITSMNLLPIGQLDGGHILYTLIGRKAHVVAYLIAGVAIYGMIFQQNFTFTALLLLLFLTGLKHPPTEREKEPLGLTRHIIGWLTLGFLFIGLMPTPIQTQKPQVQESLFPFDEMTQPDLPDEV